jgi:arylsulfatase A-like enzyme
MKRGISGTHRMNGIFLAYGDNIRPGAVLEKAQINDLAPTILYMMGLQPPAHMDGRVLKEIFNDSFQPALIQHTNAWQSDFNGNGEGYNGSGFNGEGLTDEEKEIVAERLRDLGYVG